MGPNPSMCSGFGNDQRSLSFVSNPLCVRPVGLDDLPAVAVFAIDFGAVPAVFLLPSIRDVIESQHGRLADDLYMWIEQLIPIKLDLSPEFPVNCSQCLDPVDPSGAI